MANSRPTSLLARLRRGTAWLAPTLLAALAAPLAAAGEASARVRFDAAPKIIAFADVHGAYDELTGLLRAVGVVDEQLHWAAGSTQVVATGDLLDRGADSRRVLDLLMRLQTEAAARQGRLHVTLGNHEAMNLLGDLRYVVPGEMAAFSADEAPGLREQRRTAWVARFGADAGPAFDERFAPGYFGHRAAFEPGGRYGRWLLEQPVAIAIGDTMFMHGGPSPVLAGMSLTEINLRYRTALVEYLAALPALESAGLLYPEDAYAERPALAGQRLAALPADAPQRPALAAAVERFVAADRNPLLEPDGPNWYRGAALCHECSERDVLRPFLEKHAVKRLVLGHTVARNGTVVSRFDGAVIKLDAGMNRNAYKGRAAALTIEGDSIRVLYAGEPGAASAVAPEPLYVASESVADSDAQAILRDGTVTIVGPRAPEQLEVTVEHGGRRVPAVFIAAPKDAVQRELAALRLDRALQLGLVPATVAREVQGRQGMLQLRPAKWVTQAEVQQQQLRGGGWCAMAPQFELMYAFDALIGNEARTAERMLYGKDDWMLLLTGHERSFGSSRALPAHLQARPPQPGPEMRRRLLELDAQRLRAALGDLLTERELRALLERRDSLLEPVAARAAMQMRP